jgi:flagellar motor switch protein FliG
MVGKDDPRNLGGPEKVALLMLALGEEASTKLWGLLDNDEVKEISQAMVSLGRIPASMVERVFVEFTAQVTATGSVVGSYESTERLLSRTLPKERVSTIMEEIRGPAGRTMWDKLGNVNEQVLAAFLKNEYPQTVAVVLSKVKPEHAARVLTALPEDFAIEAVNRMLKMEAVQKDVLDKVEQTLRLEFMSNLARTTRRDPHEVMAEIFNSLDRQTESRFISILEDRSRDAAERIKALMFTFEDLGRLDPGGVQMLLRTVEKDRLGLALKGASESLRDLFFSNMSERAANILREDMEAMGPVRLRDVDEAQSQVVAVAKELANTGKIVLASGRGDDELVY